MFRIVGNALPRSILTILTAIAVMVSFSLAATEPLRAAGLAVEWRDGLSGGDYYFFPEQTGDPVQFTKADYTRFSHLRIESLRFFTSLGGVNGPDCTSRFSQLGTGSKNGSVGIKDFILLKLRI